WARQHRLVAQVPPDIGCQVRRRTISSTPVFLQRLHGDPVQVALELTLQYGWIGVAVSGRNGRTRPCRADPCAGPRRLLLQQPLSDSFIARLPQLARIE